MFEEILAFYGNETKNKSFHRFGRSFNLDDSYDFDDIIVEVREKISYIENNYMVFISLYIGLSETTTYVKSYYDETEWM